MKLMMIPIFSMIALAITSSLTAGEFERLHEQLQPNPGEVWRSIPWETSLLEAQAAAVRDKKLIFIWAMDGHPLGCV